MATVTLTTTDGEFDCYLAEPEGTPRAAIVVIQEAFGLTAHIERCCDRLAAAGYLTVAPALFHRVGSPVFAYDDFEHVMPAMGSLTMEGISMDLEAVTTHLAAAGFTPASTGIVGFCMGGTVTFFGSTTSKFGAGVTFYGGGMTAGRFGFPSLVELAPALKAPWLGLYGDLDQGIPVDQVGQLRAATVSLAVPTEIVLFEGADHGFNCEDRTAVFNPGVASEAWAKMLAWFETYLG